MEQHAFEESQDLGVLSEGTKNDENEGKDRDRGSRNQDSKIDMRPTSSSSGIDRREDFTSLPASRTIVPRPAVQHVTQPIRLVRPVMISISPAESPVDSNESEAEENETQFVGRGATHFMDRNTIDRPKTQKPLVKRFVDAQKQKNEQPVHKKGYQKRTQTRIPNRIKIPARDIFRDLEGYLAEEAKLSENDAQEVAFQVLEYLANKHRVGVSHGSVRPWVGSMIAAH